MNIWPFAHWHSALGISFIYVLVKRASLCVLDRSKILFFTFLELELTIGIQFSQHLLFSCFLRSHISR